MKRLPYFSTMLRAHTIFARSVYGQDGNMMPECREKFAPHIVGRYTDRRSCVKCLTATINDNTCFM